MLDMIKKSKIDKMVWSVIDRAGSRIGLPFQNNLSQVRFTPPFVYFKNTRLGFRFCWIMWEYIFLILTIKDKGEFWSCDCIVKEKVWNGSERVDLVYKKYVKHPTLYREQTFKKFRKFVTLKIRQAKRDYYEKNFNEIKCNIKSTWK